MEDIFQILIFVAFAVLSFLPQIQKGKNKPASSPLPDLMDEETEEFFPEAEEDEAAVSSVVQKPVQQKAPARTVSVPSPKKKSEPSVPAKPSATKVRLNSRAEARRAFIYSEIFNRKYQ